jgi:hypothetical protein
MSLVNENVIPYCYVKMSSPAREAFGEEHEAGWIGSTGDQARDDVERGGLCAVPGHLMSGGAAVRGRRLIVDPEPIAEARPSWPRRCGGDWRSAPGAARG